MSKPHIRSADKKNNSNSVPRTEGELCRMLLDGSRYLINIDWQTLRPAKVSLGEIYGGDEGDGNRWGATNNSRFWPIFEDQSGESRSVNFLSSSDFETLTQAYSVSDAAEHAEAFVSIEGVALFLSFAAIPSLLWTRKGNHFELDSDEEGIMFDVAFRENSSNYTWSGSTAASSRESSTESDLLSISVFSEDDLLGSLNDELFPAANTIARQLLEDFQRTAVSLPLNGCPLDGKLDGTSEGTPHNGSSLHHQKTPNHAGTRSSQASSSGRGLNEGRDNDENSDDEGSRSRQPRKVLGGVGEKRHGKVLACPFWKLDPREHQRCLRVTLKDTSRVKQHLSRKHAPEFYCERCMAVFPDLLTHQTHIQAPQNCRPRSHIFTSITHQQQRQLSRKSKPGLSELERWFVIWDIVFPGQPRPTSPYLDTNMSEDLSRFREFAEARAPAMIAAEIHSKGAEVQSWVERQAASALEQTISRGITLLFDVWLAERASNAEPQKTSTSSHPSFLEPSEIQTTLNIPVGPPMDQETPAILTPFSNNGIAVLDEIQQGEGQTGNFIASCDTFTGNNFNWAQYIIYPNTSEDTVPATQDDTAGFDELVVQNGSNTGGLPWDFGELG